MLVKIVLTKKEKDIWYQTDYPYFDLIKEIEQVKTVSDIDKQFLQAIKGNCLLSEIKLRMKQKDNKKYFRGYLVYNCKLSLKDTKLFFSLIDETLVKNRGVTYDAIDVPE